MASCDKSSAAAVVRRGRGATYNPDNRFAPRVSETLDDGWWQEGTQQSLATEIRDEPCKTALSWNTSPDLPFDRSINPIGVANMAASIVTPAPRMPIGICHRDSILKPN